ncbi:hypothetical protein CL647_00155 [bacterium]|nr:hypothetical protein [Actinomycetota bacterium]MBE32546.1 hypothetical protein [bacterium]|tara:strand:+ start:24705 stop:26444 length:1740 start_codon:yes stop_codon:yes gene_type:complete
MIGKFIPLVIIFFLTLSPYVSATDITVKASVNRTQLSINDVLEYKLTISGAKGQPNINESFLKDFSIINRSSQQSYQLINNDFFSSQIKTFQLQPNIKGTIIIPSAKIAISGKSFETEPITITVSEGTSSQPSLQKTTSVANTKTNSKLPSGSSKDLFILAVLDKETAYVGEEIIYSIRLYRRFSAINQLLYQEPEFGMLSETLERDQNTYTQSYNGIRYYVQEVDRRSLFSYESGTITIPPATAEVQINFYYGNQVIKSNDVSINILPLPATNKPKNFSGLVGNYELDVDVNTQALIENKPIAIRLSVGGSGNLKQLSDLSFDTDPNLFKVYQSSTNDLITYIDSVKGVRHFEYIMVPKTDGELSLPNFSFSFFNPKTKRYKTISSPDQTVSIIDSGEVTERLAATDSTNSLTELRQDLRYIKESIVLSEQAKPFFKQLFSIFLIIINFFLFSNVLMSFISKTSYYQSISQSLTLKPSKRALNKIEQIKLDSNWNINDVQNSIFNYISSIINRPAQGLPIAEIKDELTQKKIDSAAITDLESLLDQCSFLAYSPDSSTPSSKLDICDKAIDIIKRINV